MYAYMAIFTSLPAKTLWLGAVEREESAAPYQDWNERIAAECYAPNARSRILDDRGKTARISNNYERISFNFGPTLLSLDRGKSTGRFEGIEICRRSLPAPSEEGTAMPWPIRIPTSSCH